MARKKAPPSRPEGGAGHRPEAQRKIDRVEMVSLVRRGWSQGMLAEKFNISRPMICMELKAIYRDFAVKQGEDTEALINIKLDELAEIKREAWMAWERSKEDIERETNEETDSKVRGLSSKVAKMREGRLPSAQYLSIICDCIKQERDLKALNPAKEVTIKGHLAVWDVLAGVPGATEGEVRRLTVEEEMEQLLQGRMIEGKVESVRETTGPLDSPKTGTVQDDR